MCAGLRRLLLRLRSARGAPALLSAGVAGLFVVTSAEDPPVLLLIAALAVVLVALLWPLAMRVREPRRAVRLATGAAVALVVLGSACAAPRTLDSHPLWLAERLSPAYGWTCVVLSCAGALLLGRGVSRPPRRSRHAAIEIAAGCGLLVVCAAVATAFTGFSWACFSSPSPAEMAAYGARAVLPARAMMLGAAAAALLVASLARIARERRLIPWLVPLAWSGWLASRASVDWIGAALASHVCSPLTIDSRHALDESIIARLIDAADVLELAAALGVGVTLAGAGLASLGGPRWRSTRVVASAACAILVIPAALLTEPFDPPIATTFPQQIPDPIWREVAGLELPALSDTDPDLESVSHVPFFDQRHVMVTLDRDGAVQLFEAARRRPVEAGQRVAARSERFWGRSLDLAADRRATVGDLRALARQAHGFEGLIIAGVTADRVDPDPRAASRWPFLEVASRSVRAVRIMLQRHDPDLGCVVDLQWSAARGWSAPDCASGDEVRTLRIPPALDAHTVQELLDGGAPLGDLLFVVEPTLDDDRGYMTATERRTPPRPARWLRHRASVLGFLGGALLALLIALTRLALELRRWRRALRIAILGDAMFSTASTLPYWVPLEPQLLSTIPRAVGGGAYRAADGGDRIRVASPLDARRHALRRLRRVSCGLLKHALWLVLPWVVAVAHVALSTA